MAFVLDCSVTMAWMFPDEATDATDCLREALLDTRAFVPALWPVETANALLVATRRGRVGQDEWPDADAHAARHAGPGSPVGGTGGRCRGVGHRLSSVGAPITAPAAARSESWRPDRAAGSPDQPVEACAGLAGRLPAPFDQANHGPPVDAV